MKEKIEKILKNFQNKYIGVIGDLMLDRTERGKKSQRQNPENKKVPIISANENFYLGGSGNVARNLISLGAKTDLYGIIGKDLYGYQIKKLCEKEGINTAYLIENCEATILKARIFIDGDYMHRSDLGEVGEDYEKNLKKIDKKTQEKIFSNLEKKISNYDALILSDYNKKIFEEDFVKKIIVLANNKKIPTICDPKPENIFYFKSCSIVCPNKEEAEKITGIRYSNNSDILYDMGKILSEKVDSRKIIITCGEDGAYTYNNGKSKMIKTKARNIVEVTGAGDTFISALTLGLVSGMDIYNAAKIANYAAGIVIEKPGTSVTNIEEISERIKEEKVL